MILLCVGGFACIISFLLHLRNRYKYVVPFYRWGHGSSAGLFHLSAVKQRFTLSSQLPERRLLFTTMPTSLQVCLSLIRQESEGTLWNVNILNNHRPPNFYFNGDTLCIKSMKHTCMPGSGGTKWVNMCQEAPDCHDVESHRKSRIKTQRPQLPWGHLAARFAFLKFSRGSSFQLPCIIMMSE